MADHNQLDNYKKDWFDWWLSDEQPPAKVESKIRETAARANADTPLANLPKVDSQPTPIEEAGATYVTVNLHVPKIGVPNFSKLSIGKVLRTTPRRAFVVPAVFAICMMLAGLAVHSFTVKYNPEPPSTKEPTQVLGVSKLGDEPKVGVSGESAKTQVSTQNLNTTQPTPANTPSDKAPFVPVAPADKPELGKYAFAKTSYDSTQGTYTYIDVMQGGLISVTERQTPQGYSTSQEAATKLSASVGAKELISVPSGIIYAYADPKTNKQTVIFSLSGLLIYINSSSSYSGSDWAAYINNLR